MLENHMVLGDVSGVSEEDSMCMDCGNLVTDDNELCDECIKFQAAQL